MKKIYFLILSSTVLFFINCTKQETKQERYEITVQNPTMLSGKGSPNIQLGKKGDFYIDLLTANLYGAKTDKGWGIPVSIKGKIGNDGQNGVDGQDGQDGQNGTNGQNGADGQDGQDGQNGSNGRNGDNGYQILSGNTPPENAFGTIGDIYLDVQNKKLYGPKNDQGWGEGILISQTITTPPVLPTDYELSSDGKSLLRWNNKGVTELDLTSIPDLNGIINLYGAFENCTTLKNITLPNSLKIIGSQTFKGTAINQIVIPEGVIAMGDFAFENCEQLLTVKLPQTLERFDYGGFSNSGLTEIVIPNKIKKIPNKAFFACWKLTSVTLNDDLEEIGDQAFSSSAISEIILPNSLKTIGSSAFSTCKQLKEINFNQVEHIKRFAFSDTPLTQVTLSNNITEVGEGVFSGCRQLSQVVIQAPITRIEGEFFRHCTALTKVTLPNTITSIETNAFYDCRNLQEIHLPEGIVRLGWSAFGHCDALTIVHLPNTITELDQQVFYSCDRLTQIKLSDNLKSIGASCFYGTNLKEVIIPEGVTYIDTSAFSDTPITKINIPTSLTKIDDFLNNTAIETLTLHNGVTEIRKGAFANCKKLISITLESEIPPVIYELGNEENELFTKSNKLKVIYVPAGSVQAYKDAPGWNAYASKIQAM